MLIITTILNLSEIFVVVIYDSVEDIMFRELELEKGFLNLPCDEREMINGFNNTNLH